MFPSQLNQWQKETIMNFGERIKQLRTARNMTQPQLAEAIGIEQSYLSKLENDKSVPSTVRWRRRDKQSFLSHRLCSRIIAKHRKLQSTVIHAWRIIFTLWLWRMPTTTCNSVALFGQLQRKSLVDATWWVRRCRNRQKTQTGFVDASSPGRSIRLIYCIRCFQMIASSIPETHQVTDTSKHHWLWSTVVPLPKEVDWLRLPGNVRNQVTAHWGKLCSRISNTQTRNNATST